MQAIVRRFRLQEQSLQYRWVLRNSRSSEWVPSRINLYSDKVKAKNPYRVPKPKSKNRLIIQQPIKRRTSMDEPMTELV